MNRPAALLWLLLGLAGCREGDVGGRVTPALPDVCPDACRAMYREPCQGLDASQCDAYCASLDDDLAGPCTDVMAEMYACAATLTWECTEDGPEPVAYGCLEESMAFAECMDTAPCAGHCQAALEAGCAPSEQACMDDCAAEIEAADWCDSDLEDLYECHGESGVACVDGEPESTSACAEEQETFDLCVAEQ